MREILWQCIDIPVVTSFCSLHIGYNMFLVTGQVGFNSSNINSNVLRMKSFFNGLVIIFIIFLRQV